MTGSVQEIMAVRRLMVVALEHIAQEALAHPEGHRKCEPGCMLCDLAIAWRVLGEAK